MENIENKINTVDAGDEPTECEKKIFEMEAEIDKMRSFIDEVKDYDVHDKRTMEFVAFYKDKIKRLNLEIIKLRLGQKQL